MITHLSLCGLFSNGHSEYNCLEPIRPGGVAGSLEVGQILPPSALDKPFSLWFGCLCCDAP